MIRSLTGRIGLVCGLSVYQLLAQVAPGQWRTHYTYDRSYDLVVYNDRVYSHAGHSLLTYDMESAEVRPITAVEGLHSASITALKVLGEHLFVGYEDGGMDLWASATVTRLSDLQETQLQLPKSIRTARIFGDRLYVAGDFGMLLYEPRPWTLKYSYLELGQGGRREAVYDMELYEDSLFLRIDEGLIHTARSSAADGLDPRRWRRPTSGRGDVRALKQHEGQLYALLGDEQKTDLLTYKQGRWTVVGTWSEAYHFLSSSTKGLLLGSDTLLLRSVGDRFEMVDLPRALRRLRAVAYVGDVVWLGDAGAGLARWAEGALEWIQPMAPRFSEFDRLALVNDQVYAFYRGPFFPTRRAELNACSIWDKGQWSDLSWNALEAPDVVDILPASEGGYYLATYAHGIWHATTAGIRRLEGGADGLTEAHTQPIALAKDNTGALLAATRADPPSLLSYSPNNGWQRLDFDLEWPSPLTRLLTQPSAAQLWGIMNEEGRDQLLLFRPQEQRARILDLGDHFPNKIHDLLLDRQDRLWIGSSRGLYVLPETSIAFEQQTHTPTALRIEGRLVLQSEAVYALELDGARRVWCATSSGIHLVDLEEDQISRPFEDARSPLPDAPVRELAMTRDGVLFMIHEQGIVSYKSRSSAPATNYSQLRIFPNPVRASFTGEVSISGLPEGAYLRITSPSGQLIRNLEARGGTATWDTTNERGLRVPSGIYILHSIQEHKALSHVSKIAILR